MYCIYLFTFPAGPLRTPAENPRLAGGLTIASKMENNFFFQQQDFS